MFGLRQREWNAVTQNIGDAVDVEVKVRPARVFGEETTVAYRIKSAGTSCGRATTFESSAEAWESLHMEYGFDLSDLGAIFSVQGEDFRLEGLNPTKRHVVEATRVSDGVFMRFAHTKVLRWLGRRDVITAGMNLGF